MIFYYIGAKEDCIPDDNDYEVMLHDYLIEELEKNEITKDSFETEEKYLEAVETYKQQLIKNSGEEAVREMITDKAINDGILSMIEVVEG